MKNKLALTIFFLFTSHVLFSAHESDQQLGLYVENDSRRGSLQPRVYDEPLTEELLQLFKRSNDLDWSRWPKSNNLTQSKDSPKMIELICAGANPDVRDHKYIGGFFLHNACLRDDIELARTCVTYGASLELEDVCGRTPVYFCKTIPMLEFFFEIWC